MDDGIKVVMSPIQLAAALSDKSVTEGETFSNRLYGGLGLIMGALELAGATALCIAPEPTGLTKAACVVVGAHSMDSINTAADQVLSGKNVRSATYRAAVEMAKQFGADDDTAWKVGLTIDVAVPIAFSLGLGAARVASVRVGKIKLIQHESVTGLKPGGHAILKHVGKTQEELAARLKLTENMVRKPNAISSFSNIDLAEASISKALSVNKEWIRAWAASQPRHNLTVTYNTGKVIGYSLFRGSDKLAQATKVKVVLKYEMYNGKPYYILTAFPEV
ncbi:RNase A-like domain-containing protein [Pseudescherichia vulneris]|uniref:RNase A-like domain-containing protein n=1 Tax=Pseudescherichia vulneris TaxID=566 RepID=UPI001EE13AB9|nr:RNase A-like domain-containing protein [Pseudescherichia vulneris]